MFNSILGTMFPNKVSLCSQCSLRSMFWVFTFHYFGSNVQRFFGSDVSKQGFSVLSVLSVVNGLGLFHYFASNVQRFFGSDVSKQGFSVLSALSVVNGLGLFHYFASNVQRFFGSDVSKQGFSVLSALSVVNGLGLFHYFASFIQGFLVAIFQNKVSPCSQRSQRWMVYPLINSDLSRLIECYCFF